MDVCARSLKAAAALLEDGSLERARSERYAGWDLSTNREMLKSGTLESISARVLSSGLDPQPQSGRQERLKNLWNRFV